ERFQFGAFFVEIALELVHLLLEAVATRPFGPSQRAALPVEAILLRDKPGQSPAVAHDVFDNSLHERQHAVGSSPGEDNITAAVLIGSAGRLILGGAVHVPPPPQFRRSVKRIPTYIIRSEIKGRTLQTIKKCEKNSRLAVEKPKSGRLCLNGKVVASGQ